MKLWLNLILIALVAAGCNSGCTKTPAVATATVPAKPPLPQLPTNAQPKLKTIKLFLGAEELDAEMALTGDQQMTGMMFRTNLTEQDAMIFPLPYPMQASFWMKNCPESLSAAYISPDGVIREIHHLEKFDTNSVVANANNIQFVLEVKDGWFDRHKISTGVLVQTEKGSLQKTFLNGK